MRYLRFTLLQSYILSIQKNKRKALLLINCGIFIAIFAVSSAIISFFIERDISEKQSEILQYQIQIKEGVPVVIDGYEQLPVQEYVKNKLEKEKPYLLKNKLPTVGGAPISRPSSDNFSEDMLKQFLKASEDITEQGLIFKTYGKETWQKLRDIAKTR